MNKIYFLLFSILFSSDQIPASEQSHPILLRNGIIHTVSSGTIQGPELLFENGIIKAIGHGLEITAKTEIIDVTGKHIYPVLISAGSSLVLQEINCAYVLMVQMNWPIIQAHVMMLNMNLILVGQNLKE